LHATVQSDDVTEDQGHPQLSPAALRETGRSLAAAVATFNVNLYEDQGGGVGKTDRWVDSVEVAMFYVEITAREWDRFRAGLSGVALDLAWNPDLLTTKRMRASTSARFV